MNDHEYAYLKHTILSLTNFRLENYKDRQMRRRLAAFIESKGHGVMSYCRLIEGDREALRLLEDYLTINVSEFFRDTVQFDMLQNTILPALLARKPNLNVWSAGCSHGGEPYSLAITLEELSPGRFHKIVGTDIDDKVLSIARNGGPYTDSDVTNVEGRLLQKYFEGSVEGHMVKRDLRRRVEFLRHDLLQDRFESGFDLVLCRNVVIYFTEEAKARLYRDFHDSLTNGGVLFTGATEALMRAATLGFRRLQSGFYAKDAPIPETRTSVGSTPAHRRA